VTHPFYNQELHGPYHETDVGDLVLEEGRTLRGCRLAYATHGTLSPAKDNVVLVPTWFSGTSKIMEDVYIGEGRALDPARWFIVVVNQIGSGLSSSPHNTPSPHDGPNFPRVRIGDDVAAQHRLLTEHLGIDRLALVVGGSMGAQQTYEWAVRHPDMVQRAAPIAGFARNTDHDYLFTESLIQALACDPAYADGEYVDSRRVHRGLKRHAGIWAYMGLCPEFYTAELWRELGFASRDDFLTGFVEAYFLPMDPGDLLCMAWKWQRGDVSRHTGGDLAAALGRIKARTFVLPISTDQFFPVADCRAEQQLIPGSELRVLTSQWGHFGLFGTEPDYLSQVDKHLQELLNTPVT
jgi:homoserine O-acetyltransferase